MPTPDPKGHALSELGSGLGLIASERVVVRAEQPRGERVHGQRLHPLGVARREKCGQLGSVFIAEQVSPAEMHRVHHRGEVVHLRFERRELTRREPIGQSGCAMVDHDDPSEPGQSIEDVRHAGQLPVEEQVRDEPGDVDEIAGALPEDLERDVRPIGHPRVANLWDLHGPYGRPPRGRAATCSTFRAVLTCWSL
jgi:hypothetical protein